MNQQQALAFAGKVAEAGVSAVTGDAKGAVRSAIDAAIMLATDEELAQYLTDAAVRRAELAADAAEKIKFGFGEDPSITEDDGT